MQLARTLTTLALSTLLFACGDAAGPGRSAGAPDPEQVATHFLEAVQRQDEAAFANLLTDAAVAGLESGDGFQLDGAKLESFELGATEVKGVHAEVAVTALEGGNEQDMHVLLRRGAPGWRVYGMRVDIGDGSFTIDLEETAGLMNEIGEQIGEGMQEAFAEMQNTWEQGGTLEEIAAKRAVFESLRSVSRKEHEAAWRVEVEGGGRPALEVLEELAAPAGLSLEGGAHADALAAPVSLVLGGVSRVEAIERIAAGLGLHPIWPAPEEAEPLTFAAGPRPLPAAFAGPFLVEVTEVTEEAPRPVGSLRVAARALGLAPGALAFQTEMAEVVHLERVRSAANQPLTDEETRHMSTPDVRGGYFTFALDKDLSGLLRGVESIESIAGSIKLSLPVKVEAATFERGDDAPRTLAFGTLTAKSWGQQTEFRLDGEEEALEGLTIRTSPRKASGDPLGVQFGSSSGWGQQVQASVQCPEEPAAVDLKLCSVEEVSYPFTLAPVPLARFAEQPERMQPLAFDGPAPIAVELVGVIRRNGEQAEVTLKLHNRSNKDANMVVLDFHYVDAAGAELESFWHTLNGPYDFDTGGFGAVVAAGESIEQDTHAAFVPANATGIRFTPVKLEFPDGTGWEPED